MTRRLAFFGGKGGVGKTTLAAAFAMCLAQRGERTLLVSTDPAHSTGDILGLQLGGEPSEVADNLWAIEIDAGADAARYIDRIKDEAREAVSPEVLSTVRQQLDMAKHAPGTEESALFDRVCDLIGLCPDAYERIVFDTAPTGHTLRLLALPALVQAWMEGVIRQREKVAGVERMWHNLSGQEQTREDPLLQRLRARKDKFHHARHRLLEDARFHLVLLPERLAIEETTRALKALTDHGIEVAAVIVNRLLPELSEGAYLQARLEQQSEYLREIETRFNALRIIRIEQDARDVTQRRQLLKLAAQLDALEPA